MNNLSDSHDFIGSNLKLARLLSGFTLAELAEKIGASRQYIHQLENSNRMPSNEQLASLAGHLSVNEGFFFVPPTGVLTDDAIHFRSNRTSKVSSRTQAKAHIALFARLLNILSNYVVFPEPDFPDEPEFSSALDIERIAERARSHWHLGFGPIDNMTRTAELAGAITTTFKGVSLEVDALSGVMKHPLIVRNDAKDSPGRLRFDIAHEVGHLIMHKGIVTGCKQTESEANRFASAFLMPRSSFGKEFYIGSRLNWGMVASLKERWGVSKAAILFRARQLDLLNEAQYKRAIIQLKKYESKKEKDDHLISYEKSELIPDAVQHYVVSYGKTVDNLLNELNVTEPLLNQILDFDINDLRTLERKDNVRPLIRAIK